MNNVIETINKVDDGFLAYVDYDRATSAQIMKMHLRLAKHYLNSVFYLVEHKPELSLEETVRAARMMAWFKSYPKIFNRHLRDLLKLI